MFCENLSKHFPAWKAAKTIQNNSMLHLRAWSNPNPTDSFENSMNILYFIVLDLYTLTPINYQNLKALKYKMLYLHCMTKMHIYIPS